jgi:hypothetical protein
LLIDLHIHLGVFIVPGSGNHLKASSKLFGIKVVPSTSFWK